MLKTARAAVSGDGLLIGEFIRVFAYFLLLILDKRRAHMNKLLLFSCDLIANRF